MPVRKGKPEIRITRRSEQEQAEEIELREGEVSPIAEAERVETVESEEKEAETSLERPEQSSEEKLQQVGDFFGFEIQPDLDNEELEAHLGERGLEKLKLLNEVLARLAEQKGERERIAKMSRMYRAVIGALTQMIDLKSPYTAEHSFSVTRIADELSKKYGFDEVNRLLILDTYLLHDLGKIETPQKTLDKPGGLTNEEFDKIKEHPSTGARMLLPLAHYQQNPHLYLATRGHHEKWGSGGYPDDRTGEAIDLASRTGAAADVFDALARSRPYKDGWPIEKTVDVLVTDSGTRVEEKWNPVKQEKEKQAVIAHFDPMATGLLESAYENRRLSRRFFFQPKEALYNDIKDKQKELFPFEPFGEKDNEKWLEEKRTALGKVRELAEIRSSTYAQTVAGEIKNLEGRSLRRLQDLRDDLFADNETTEREIDRRDDMFYYTLGLMAKATDAKAEWMKGIPENVAHYTAMIGKEMGFEGERLKALTIKSLLANVGMMGVYERILQSGRRLSESEFAEIKKHPKLGRELLEPLEEFFPGVSKVAGAHHLEEYGEEDLEPDRETAIISMAEAYQAMVNARPYRGEDKRRYTPEEAIEELRKKAKTEDEKEVLEAIERLRGYTGLHAKKTHKSILTRIREGSLDKLRYIDHEEETTARYTLRLSHCSGSQEKATVCTEAIEELSRMGYPGALDRFLEAFEGIYYRDILNSDVNRVMESQYAKVYKSGERVLRNKIYERLNKKESEKARRAASALSGAYAENNRKLPWKIAGEISRDLEIGFKKMIHENLAEYRKAFERDDLDEVEYFYHPDGESGVIQKHLTELGDEGFEADIKKEIDRIQNEIAEQKLAERTELLDELIGKRQVLLAIPFFEDLKRTLRRRGMSEAEIATYEFGSGGSLADKEKEMYAEGSLQATQMFKEAGREGNFKEMDIWAERVRTFARWGDLSEKMRKLNEESLERERMAGYEKAIRKQLGFLEAKDLGLDDLPLIGRWVKNIEELRGRLEEGELDPSLRWDDKKEEGDEEGAGSQIGSGMTNAEEDSRSPRPSADGLAMTERGGLETMKERAYQVALENIEEEVQKKLDGVDTLLGRLIRKGEGREELSGRLAEMRSLYVWLNEYQRFWPQSSGGDSGVAPLPRMTRRENDPTSLELCRAGKEGVEKMRALTAQVGGSVRTLWYKEIERLAEAGDIRALKEEPYADEDFVRGQFFLMEKFFQEYRNKYKDEGFQLDEGKLEASWREAHEVAIRSKIDEFQKRCAEEKTMDWHDVHQDTKETLRYAREIDKDMVASYMGEIVSDYLTMNFTHHLKGLDVYDKMARAEKMTDELLELGAEGLLTKTDTRKLKSELGEWAKETKAYLVSRGRKDGLKNLENLTAKLGLKGVVSEKEREACYQKWLKVTGSQIKGLELKSWIPELVEMIEGLKREKERHSGRVQNSAEGPDFALRATTGLAQARMTREGDDGEDSRSPRPSTDGLAMTGKEKDIDNLIQQARESLAVVYEKAKLYHENLTALGPLFRSRVERVEREDLKNEKVLRELKILSGVS